MIRDSYRIDHPKAKVSTSNLISFRGSHYSVPPGYVAKSMTLKTIDKMLYIYDSTELIAQHLLSGKKVNYLPSHYEVDIKRQNVINHMVKISNFPHLKTLADFEFSFQPQINDIESSRNRRSTYFIKCHDLIPS